jgi:hypothetical protein
MTTSAPIVDITISGRGGGITYREGGHRIEFDWEFGMSPAVALVWGPKRVEWDGQYPWASGRQAAIYEVVGAEIVRQKAPGGAFEYDLELGHLTILNETGARARGLYVDKSAAAADALRRHTSVDARLAAAEATQDSATIETVLAREIRQLSQPRDGLDRAMRLAAAHPSEAIRQALLWASYNATECAPRCAEMLLTLTSPASGPLDRDAQSILARLGKHSSDFDRDEAFAELSRRVGMVLDQTERD